MTIIINFYDRNLKKTDIKFTIGVSGHDVLVTAYYLPPEIFQTTPVFFLSTDVPENDYLSKTVCHKLYDFNPGKQKLPLLFCWE